MESITGCPCTRSSVIDSVIDFIRDRLRVARSRSRMNGCKGSLQGNIDRDSDEQLRAGRAASAVWNHFQHFALLINKIDSL